MTRTRAARALALAMTLLAAGCGGDDDGGGEAAGTTSTGGGGGQATSSSTTEPGPSGNVVQITVAGGNVHGPEVAEVAEGDDVTIQVTSDVADEVHVHGYDLLAEVEAGGTAEIQFTADLPGSYEVELESAGLVLFELRVG